MINENILKNDLFVNVHKEHFRDYQTGAKGTYYSQKDVFDCIDNQPQIGGWIPCGERLPEEYGDYLVTYGFNDVDVKVVDVSSYSENGFEFINVIAWQPLPEAYHG